MTERPYTIWHRSRCGIWVLACIRAALAGYEGWSELGRLRAHAELCVLHNRPADLIGRKRNIRA